MRKNWKPFILAALLTALAAFGIVFAASSGNAENTMENTLADIERRLTLLELALVSQSPQDVANTWAKGVMTRNGALQFAVLSDRLRLQYEPDFAASQWCTGASSPWIVRYRISGGKQSADGTWQFAITFYYTDSTKQTYVSVSNIRIGAKEINSAPLQADAGYWCVTEIEDSPLYIEE